MQRIWWRNRGSSSWTCSRNCVVWASRETPKHLRRHRKLRQNCRRTSSLLYVPFNIPGFVLCDVLFVVVDYQVLYPLFWPRMRRDVGLEAVVELQNCLCIVHYNVHCCIIMLHNSTSSFIIIRPVDVILSISRSSILSSRCLCNFLHMALYIFKKKFCNFFLNLFQSLFSWGWSFLSQRTILQCFDTFGWAMEYVPGKIVPEMSYYVSGGTLNPTHSLRAGSIISG